MLDAVTFALHAVVSESASKQVRLSFGTSIYPVELVNGISACCEPAFFLSFKIIIALDY